MSALDVLIGFAFGVLLLAGVVVSIRDEGRTECERPLPRTQKCVQQWVPEVTP